MVLSDIVKVVGGLLDGSGDIEITGVAGLAEAGAGELSFLSNPRYAGMVASTRASAVIVSKDWSGESNAAIVRVDNPDAAFAEIAGLLAPPEQEFKPGINPTATVAADAEIGRDVHVGAFCSIGQGVRIGDRCVLDVGCYIGPGSSIGCDGKLYAHVCIKDRVSVGERVIIHPGAVVGSDGFGYVREEEGWKKIPQIGVVVIGNDVEIGANTTIDRARFGKTIIGDGVKLDNLVQVAHNVRIGAHTAIAALVGISGSTVIGERVRIGGQAGLEGHIKIGDDAVIGGRSGVTKDVAPRTFVSGYPAMPHDKAAKLHAHTMRLPALKERLKKLEEKVDSIEEGKGESG